MLPAERDHQIAESLQRVLLRTPPPETLRNLPMEAFYELAVEEATVCGDYFDAVAVDEGTVALSTPAVAATDGEAAGTPWGIRLLHHRA